MANNCDGRFASAAFSVPQSGAPGHATRTLRDEAKVIKCVKARQWHICEPIDGEGNLRGRRAQLTSPSERFGQLRFARLRWVASLRSSGHRTAQVSRCTCQFERRFVTADRTFREAIVRSSPLLSKPIIDGQQNVTFRSIYFSAPKVHTCECERRGRRTWPATDPKTSSKPFHSNRKKFSVFGVHTPAETNTRSSDFRTIDDFVETW